MQSIYFRKVGPGPEPAGGGDWGTRAPAEGTPGVACTCKPLSTEESHLVCFGPNCFPLQEEEKLLRKLLAKVAKSAAEVRGV